MHLLPAFGPIRMDEVEPRHLTRWSERAAGDGTSARLIVRALMVASQVFTHAQRHHDLGRNPASGRLVPRPSVKYDRSRFNVLTPQQLPAIAEAMPTAHGRAAVLLSAWDRRARRRAGRAPVARRGVDRSAPARTALVRPERSPDHEGRARPLGADDARRGGAARRLSRRGHATEPDDLLPVTEAGGRVSSFALRDHFYVALKAAGLGHLREADPPIRWHDLRHTFGTRAAKAMPSLSDVQALLGHADIQTTQRYVHHVPGARDAERLAAAFADEPDPLERAVFQPVSQTGQFPGQRP